MKKNTSYGEILRHENEITKLKIQAEFGLELNGSSELNPAIENIWLNQILEYERSMINNKRIMIGELLGNPVFESVETISDNELPEKIQFVMSMLQAKNIVVESIDGIDDREMYRFITKELILQETDTCAPKNMICCFIYEEFHPNDEADIKRNAEGFMNVLPNREDKYYERFLSTSSDEENEIETMNLRRKLELFREAFDKIMLNEFLINSIVMNDDVAELHCNYKFSVLPPGSKTFQLIEGAGKMNFQFMYDDWGIVSMEMKGVV